MSHDRPDREVTIADPDNTDTFTEGAAHRVALRYPDLPHEQVLVLTDQEAADLVAALTARLPQTPTPEVDGADTPQDPDMWAVLGEFPDGSSRFVCSRVHTSRERAQEVRDMRRRNAEEAEPDPAFRNRYRLARLTAAPGQG